MCIRDRNKDNEVVCIPGLKGREPKEISLKNLAHIIQCRMEEMLEQVYFEIKNSGLEKQLSAGIVLTGGGAQLKHLRQLTEYVTGMSVRIGYPNEHLAKSNVQDVTSPLFATGVGLVMKGFDYIDLRRPKVAENTTQKVKGHSQPSKVGGFFERVLKGTTELLNDDEA